MTYLTKVKFPVNYVRNKDTGEQKLVYRLIDVVDNEKRRYQQYAAAIEKIFQDADNHFEIIRMRIKNLIIKSRHDHRIFEFLADNQWLLRFSSTEDINLLMSYRFFPIQTVTIDFPVDALFDGANKKIFYAQKNFPIWQKKEQKFSRSLIEWLFLDEMNTYEERLWSVILSKVNYIHNVVLNNLWLLMYVSDRERLNMLQLLDVPYSDVDVVVSYQENGNHTILKKKEICVPSALEREYINFFNEIEEMLNDRRHFDQNILEYCYKHSKYYLAGEQGNLLRQNMWILNLVHLDTRTKMLQLLDVPVIPQKKLMTLTRKKNKDGLYSKQISINSNQFKEYELLNRQLFKLLENQDSIAEQDVISFIEKDERVLDMWPWLVNYIKDPVKKDIFSSKAKRKK